MFSFSSIFPVGTLVGDVVCVRAWEWGNHNALNSFPAKSHQRTEQRSWGRYQEDRSVRLVLWANLTYHVLPLMRVLYCTGPSQPL
jgi:hypothetical protein